MKYVKNSIKSSKIAVLGLIFTVAAANITVNTGCKTKEGCGLEEKYKADLSSKKRGKSNLFSKKQRKKMR